MPLPSDEATEEKKPPCSVCAKPSPFSGFWGKRLCEPCWFDWKAAFDTEFERLGKRSPQEPGVLFEQWFAAAKVKGRAA
jgi:hypothetical protein